MWRYNILIGGLLWIYIDLFSWAAQYLWREISFNFLPGQYNHVCWYFGRWMGVKSWGFHYSTCRHSFIHAFHFNMIICIFNGSWCPQAQILSGLTLPEINLGGVGSSCLLPAQLCTLSFSNLVSLILESFQDFWGPDRLASWWLLLLQVSIANLSYLLCKLILKSPAFYFSKMFTSLVCWFLPSHSFVLTGLCHFIHLLLF